MAGTSKLRLLLVDDHPLVLQGFRAMVVETDDMEVMAAVSTAAAAMAALQGTEFDLVVSDMTLPDQNGLALLKLIKAQKPDLPVLIVSMHAEEALALRAIQQGAAGYVKKDADSRTLLDAMRRAGGGRTYLSGTAAEHLASQLGNRKKMMLHERLSEREFEVFCLIAGGNSLTAIGLLLGVSIKTVSGYRSRILAKTSFRSNAEITRYALENNLIS
jgi:two-component system, NarL family, invasion response regulator UvrY